MESIHQQRMSQKNVTDLHVINGKYALIFLTHPACSSVHTEKNYYKKEHKIHYTLFEEMKNRCVIQQKYSTMWMCTNPLVAAKSYPPVDNYDQQGRSQEIERNVGIHSVFEREDSIDLFDSMTVFLWST